MTEAIPTAAAGPADERELFRLTSAILADRGGRTHAVVNAGTANEARVDYVPAPPRSLESGWRVRFVRYGRTVVDRSGGGAIQTIRAAIAERDGLIAQ